MIRRFSGWHGICFNAQVIGAHLAAQSNSKREVLDLIDRLNSLAILGPGLGLHGHGQSGIQDFAQRRVDHLRERVDAGDLDPQKLEARLQARFGDAANQVIGPEGLIDFDKLQAIITEQQADKLQNRLESLFGAEARDIVAADGSINQAQVERLQAVETIDRLHARLVERFNDRADGIVSDDGSVDIDALRELFHADDIERSYEPTPREDRPDRRKEPPLFNFLT